MQNVVEERAGAAAEGAPIVILGGTLLAREGIAMVLPQAYGIPVRALAAASVEATAVLRDVPDPTIVLQLCRFPGDDLPTSRALVSDPRCTGLIVAGVYRDKQEVLAVLEAGARACVSYDAGATRLVEAIERARAGTGYLCPVLGAMMTRESDARTASDPPMRPLTEREADVLALIVQGLTDRQAAAELGLSMKTVHTHRQNIMGKLGVRNATTLVRRALQLGLVRL